jgi:mitochondrial Rho GTPase 1
MTLQGWLAQWRCVERLISLPRSDFLNSMTALLDHRTTLAYMAYLGFPSTPLTSALTLTRPRRTERRRGRITRNVFLCYVCGASGSGKSALLRSFVGKPFRTAYEPTTKPLSVVNSVEVDGAQKYLVVSTKDLLRRRRAHIFFCSAARIREQV